MTTLSGTLLQPRSATDCAVAPNAVLRIGDDGRIVEVAAAAAPSAAAQGRWIIPGFIDAHLHLPQWDRRGIDGMSLFDWQRNIGYPAELRMRDPAAARRLAEQFAAGVIANGTTTVAAFGSPFASEVDQTFAVFERAGLRAIYGMMLNDVDTPCELSQRADEALDQSRQLAANWHGKAGGRLMYAFSPRASIRCSERLMRGSAALADMLQCYLQTHVAESLDELAAVRQRFAEHVDEVDVFGEMGMLMPRTILAHGVFLSAQQRREVAQRGAALVHCPTGNLFRESGLMDYVAQRSAGIRVALGSSVAGGPDPFMPRVAVQGLHTAKAIKVHTLPRRSMQVPRPPEAWWMLTRGGAEALGLGDRIGSIEAGFEADCLVVRPEPWIAELPPEQQVSALLYTISPHQIEHVYIAGRRVGP
jgi:guanine deaminase